jgi:4-cresol dehydrogenase (hydroxylating)
LLAYRAGTRARSLREGHVTEAGWASQPTATEMLRESFERHAMIAARLSEAIACWEKVLGKAQVITNPSLLHQYLTNVSQFAPPIVPAILMPRTQEDVRHIVGIANAYQAPLYPVSTGKNWGIGSMLPVKDHCSIVLLNQMQAILEVNAPLRYAVIEPGVTQKQLADYLHTVDRSLTFNFTGAGTDTSILGNILDRGTGFLGQRTQNLLAMEIVLGNQQVVRTGFCHLYQSLPEARPFYVHGVGPDLNQLFTQANYGIVTSAAISLVPRKRYVLAVARMDEDEVQQALDIALKLKDLSLTQDGPLLLNAGDPRFSFLGVYTTRCASSQAWVCITRLSGVDRVLAVQKDEVSQHFAPVCTQVEFYDAADAGARSRMPRSIQAILDILDGHPTNFNLEAMARLNPHYNGRDCDVDGNLSIPGFVCVVPVVPLSGALTMPVLTLVADVSKSFRVRPGISFTPMSGLAMEGFIRVYFDRTNPSEVERAHAWSQLMYEQLTQKGYHSYRLSVHHMLQSAYRKDNAFFETISAIKRVLDPHAIISPGRYL